MASFIQSSDIHIGECRSLEGYLERHRSVLEQIIEAAASRGLPLILPGDLFHRKDTTYKERFLASWFLGEIEKRKIPCIVTTGNHDHLGGEETQLDDYKFMPFQYVKVVTWRPEIHIIGEVGFICISWGGYTTEEIKTTVTTMLPRIAHLKYRVVMLHECIVGSKADNGFILPKGTAIPFIPEITYWAIGDIHGHQPTNVGNGWYAGAPAQFKFDDTLLKGVIRVDLDKPQSKPEFIPVVSKPLKVVTSVDEITEDAYYQVKGSFEEVLKGNKNSKVVKTEWVREAMAPVEYQKVGIVDGLPEFLAEKGIASTDQTYAIDWVRKLLNLDTSQL